MAETAIDPKKPYLQHLTNATSLKTTYEETRAGFVSLALERNRRASPFVKQAQVLKAKASAATNAQSLLKISDIQPCLLTAAGVSDKATGHLNDQDKIEAIQGLLKNFLEPAGSSFVEELVYRFLLTRGDTLGGSMRNVGGELAQRKLTRMIISSLTLTKLSYYWLHKNNGSWIKSTDDDADIELFSRGISWRSNNRNRTILYNLTVPAVRKNVDVSLFNCNYSEIETAKRTPQLYIALGELKGGIDPAGADEHWKTANSALERIRTGFRRHNLSPLTFFVGAAIVDDMAIEIWNQLESGTLSNAANLVKESQLISLCNWLLSL
jgi:hypothetical protein